MPTIAITSPHSDTPATSPVSVEGTTDGVDRNLTYKIICKAATTGMMIPPDDPKGDPIAPVDPNGNWVDPLTLAAGAYDIRATLYQVTDVGEFTALDHDIVVNVQVGGVVPIGITSPGVKSAADDPHSLIGTYRPDLGDDVRCVLMHWPKLGRHYPGPHQPHPKEKCHHFHKLRVIAHYSPALLPTMKPYPLWCVHPVVLPRPDPKKGERQFVLLALLLKDKQVVATATRAVGPG